MDDSTQNIEINDPKSREKLKTVAVKDGVPNGELVIYNEDGSISHKLNFVDGILSGPAEFYQGDQILMTTTFKNGQQNGETIMFMNSKESAVMYYQDGNLNGPFLSYDDQGNLIREVNYVNGKMNGECFMYYPDGAVMEQAMYKDDKLEGEVQKYYPSGVIREICFFEKGVPVGTVATYDINGNLIESKEV